MTDQPILSGDEIAALMGREEPSARQDGASRDPRPFSFGSGSSQPSAALPALDRINERLARRIRDLIEPYIRAKPRVIADPAVLRPLRDWQAEQRQFVGLSLFTMKPLKGTLTVCVPSEFVSRLVDAYYGGTGADHDLEAREFTATEERLLARLSENLVGLVAEAWREVAPIEPALRGRETSPALTGVGGPDETAVICRFIVTPPHGRPASIDILFPAAALRSVEGALAAKVGDDSGRGEEWRNKLSAALADIRIDARTVLARPELSVGELVQLKVGDVIPVSIPAMVPLLVEGRTVALGSIGEQDGKAALKVDKITRRMGS
ncbi:MAG TPA: FliM/FliN family flagellar motor switch protein [Allosphingosinicella sp.]